MTDWAVILGASSGIGKACALKLAEKGINIFGIYLRRPKNQIEILISELESFGVKVIFNKMSATNAEKRAEAIKKLKSLGEIRVKVFVHSLAFGALKPFIENAAKGVFILAVTSNSSASEIQEHENQSNPLYKKVIQIAMELNTNENIGLVVGATKTEVMQEVRELSNGMPWLIPGVGTQGGDLETALKISHKSGIGIINVSRGVLYAGDGSLNDVVQSAKNYTEKIRSMVWNPINC